MKKSPVLTSALFFGLILAHPFCGSAAESDLSAPQAQLKLVAEGFTAPIALKSLPDQSGRLVIADQAGMVHLLHRDGSRAEKLFLDLRDQLSELGQGMEERGLLDIAFHPKFAETKKIYVVYSAPKRVGAPEDWDHTMHLSEFTVKDPELKSADKSSEKVLLQIDEPDWNHNSGRIAFGPDGLLYMTVGDGGAPNDVGRRGHAPEGNGQHLQTLLGKVLRIDVDKGDPYAIPSNNPFADGKKALPEVYAYGIRNPWGLSFDRNGSPDPILVDVGQDRWEEINIIRNGGNYGWRVREGFDGFDHENPRTPPENAPKAGADGKPFVDPVGVYKTLRGNPQTAEGYGVTITGGYVYRGEAIPKLKGHYVFADWSVSMGFPSGTMLVASGPDHAKASETWSVKPLPLKDHPDGRITGFIWALGEDSDGELYVLTNGANMVHGERGKVFKLVAP